MCALYSCFSLRCSILMASLQTIKEGPLSKRGKINKEWRQRQFVLNGKQLSYFKGGVSSELLDISKMFLWDRTMRISVLLHSLKYRTLHCKGRVWFYHINIFSICMCTLPPPHVSLHNSWADCPQGKWINLFGTFIFQKMIQIMC